jgi:hypothetical protein
LACGHSRCSAEAEQRADATFASFFAWAQAKEPFDEATLAYIGALDIRRDEHLLRSLGLREASIATFRIGCTLLQEGAALGLRLKDLADVMLREPGLDYTDNYGPLRDSAAACEAAKDGERPSTLERLVAMAKEAATGTPLVPPAREVFGDAELAAFRGLLRKYIGALLAARAGLS